MKEITLRVPDDMVEAMTLIAEKMMAAEGFGCDDDLLSLDEVDRCVKNAIESMQKDGGIKDPRDYAWIMMTMNSGKINDIEDYYTPLPFIEYLYNLGIKGVPKKTCLYDARSSLLNIESIDDWVFLDETDHAETIRRRNVGKRFIREFYKSKRSIAERTTEK